jgi:predicted DNA-binding transcriptional regulator AlpA
MIGMKDQSKRERQPTGAVSPNPTATVPTTPQVLTVAEVAARLKVPESTIYERTRFRGRQGSVPLLPHRRVGKYLRFISTEIDQWLLSLPQGSQNPKRRYTKPKER